MPRTYIRNEFPRRTDFQGNTSVYCRQCGREIWRQASPQVRTVTKCAICVLKEQGVVNPEDHVLTQYYMSNDPTRMPTPIDADVSLEGGILLLQREENAKNGIIPQVGGFFGTVMGLFKTIGFLQGKEEETVSKEVATRKRAGRESGLYSDRVK